jgi:putative component of membrane protein insertase Oxa1/YidC/SpoIIIJ protein YidD
MALWLGSSQKLVPSCSEYDRGAYNWTSGYKDFYAFAVRFQRVEPVDGQCSRYKHHLVEEEPLATEMRLYLYESMLD